LKKFVIIVAGGTGTRMNLSTPKQFLLLAGRPMLMYSLEAFFFADPHVNLIMTLPDAFIEAWKKLCSEHGFDRIYKIVSGGETRFHSVKNALEEIHDDGFVAIHDGARPLITCELIHRCFEEAVAHGNAVPGIPVHESVRMVKGEENWQEDRSNIRIIQTPQVFQVVQIKKAYELPYNPVFTDDASVLEQTGIKVHLVNGDPRNLKITRLLDLHYAEVLLQQGT